MNLILRSMALAVLTALILIVLSPASVHAQSWSSTVTSGFTTVESRFQDGAYTWTLKNNSSLPEDLEPAFDVLVWSLTPFQVNSPASVVAPYGWQWTGGNFEVISNSKKYHTPHSVAPGGSVVFQYTPDPDGSLVNSGGPQPPSLAFTAHVAAVVPGSGSLDGISKWQPVNTRFGGTWYDQSVEIIDESTNPVPEPHGFLMLAFGVIGMGLHGVRRTMGGRALHRV